VNTATHLPGCSGAWELAGQDLARTDREVSHVVAERSCHSLLRNPAASAVCDFLMYLEKAGIAIAARMPMIATTIMSSTRVNPLCFLFRMAHRR